MIRLPRIFVATSTLALLVILSLLNAGFMSFLNMSQKQQPGGTNSKGLAEVGEAHTRQLRASEPGISVRGSEANHTKSDTVSSESSAKPEVDSAFAASCADPAICRLPLSSPQKDGKNRRRNRQIRNRLISNTTMLSPLHDQTLEWDVMHRAWFDASKTKPPAMLMLTNLGWNQPNQTLGRQIYRGLRTRDLIQGIINHPWFHPTAWEDINDGDENARKTFMETLPTETRYYIFLDRETCGEGNSPNYNHGMVGNMDSAQGQRGDCCGDREHYSDAIMKSNTMTLLPNARFVLFDCGGHGPKRPYQADRRRYPDTHKLVFVSLSATHDQLLSHDIGLPPSANYPCHLTKAQRNDIHSCRSETTREYLLSFSGHLWRNDMRRALARLEINRTKDVYMRKGKGVSTEAGAFFQTLGMNSLFSAAPRGDNLFSYRLLEVMSCGSIAVIHADDWVFPFQSHLMNWSEIALVLPERRANETLEILESISVEERCRMRRKSLDMYDRYMATGGGVVNGIIETLLTQPLHE
jgi:hypothetical protein